jgi:hypothetical protein
VRRVSACGHTLGVVQGQPTGCCTPVPSAPRGYAGWYYVAPVLDWAKMLRYCGPRSKPAVHARCRCVGAAMHEDEAVSTVPASVAVPTSTLTFLFTDVEGSTPCGSGMRR